MGHFWGGGELGRGSLGGRIRLIIRHVFSLPFFRQGKKAFFRVGENEEVEAPSAAAAAAARRRRSQGERKSRKEGSGKRRPPKKDVAKTEGFSLDGRSKKGEKSPDHEGMPPEGEGGTDMGCGGGGKIETVENGDKCDVGEQQEEDTSYDMYSIVHRARVITAPSPTLQPHPGEGNFYFSSLSSPVP